MQIRRWILARLASSLASLSLIAACGGDSATPPTSYDFVSPAVTMSAGATAILKLHSSSGDVSPSGLIWGSSNTAAVQVSGGLITAIAPGTATITASGKGASASATVTVAPDLSAGAFGAPLGGDNAFSNVFDHDAPFEFTDNNGYVLSFWGEKLGGIDGHNGYDWPVSQGTPVLAAGPGTVIHAGNEAPFFCTLLNATVSGLWVDVEHGLSNGDVIRTQYGHFSRIDVQAGQHVSAGQQLGLSGTTGCSTGPHLHFGAFKWVPGTQQFVVIDPYGWDAPGADPWGVQSGVASQKLWTTTTPPAIYRQLIRVGAYPKPRFVAIKTLRYLGINDDANPNNEFVELDVNPDLASFDFSNDTLRNRTGQLYIVPAGFQLPGGATVRIYSGTGTNSATTLYMNRTTPMWNNAGDCLLLVDTLNRALIGTAWGAGLCPATSPSVLTEPAARDYRPPELFRVP